MRGCLYKNTVHKTHNHDKPTLYTHGFVCDECITKETKSPHPYTEKFTKGDKVQNTFSSL